MERRTQCTLDAGELSSTLTIKYILFPKHCHSVNASFGVGSYFSANDSSVASPNIFWLNNFQTLYSSFGIIIATCILYITVTFLLMIGYSFCVLV